MAPRWAHYFHSAGGATERHILQSLAPLSGYADRTSFRKPTRLTNWPGFVFSNLSVTADGKRLAFLRSRLQINVYVGELQADGTRLKAPRRLTTSGQLDFVEGWTSDSKAVLFTSNRNGTFDIFKQGLEDSAAEAIVVGPEDEMWPRSSPDGSWVLYWALPRGGGPPELVLNARVTPLNNWFRCPSRPGASCVFSELNSKSKAARLLCIDPVKGRGGELARIDLGSTPGYGWDLSPDGSRIAVIQPDGRIRVLALSSGAVGEVRIKGWAGSLFVAWSADGKSLFTIAQSAKRKRDPEFCSRRAPVKGEGERPDFSGPCRAKVPALQNLAYQGPAGARGAENRKAADLENRSALPGSRSQWSVVSYQLRGL